MRRPLHPAALGLMLVLCAVSCSDARSGSLPYTGNAVVDQRHDGYSGTNRLGTPTAANGPPPPRPTHDPTTPRGRGVSARGIICIVLAFIFACMGVYYFSMCYPLLCRKERKYDMIEREDAPV